MEISDIKKIAEIDLYEILNVNQTDDVKQIKKNYKKIVLKIHPDKPTGDRQVYELVNLSYVVLKNEETRQLYNHERRIFLENNTTFNDLKNLSRDKPIKLTKENALKEYYMQENKLNEKHGFNVDNINPITQSEMMNRLNNLNFNRNNFINSHSEKVKKQNLSNYDFNEQFISDGIIDENTTSEIMAFNDGSNMSISNYSNIDNFDLYSDSGCSTANYSSLNNAFNQRIPDALSNNYSDHNNINDNDRSRQKDKLMEYNNLTNKLKVKINDFIN